MSTNCVTTSSKGEVDMMENSENAKGSQGNLPGSENESYVMQSSEQPNRASDSTDKVFVDVNNANGSSQYKPMSIKKKHRRGSRRNKRRKYKPYSELSWEEKKAVEERDSRRAVSIRKKYMHEKGRPLAPFNTSQFLMAEHDTEEPDLHVSHHHHHEQHTRLSSSADDTGESSISDEEQDIEEVRNFLQKDFTETYDRLHSELLHRMNKNELVNEYMQLEDKVENLEKELAVIKSNGVKLTNGMYSVVDVAPVSSRVNKDNSVSDDETCRKKLEVEVEKLREENRQLHLENSVLRPKNESLSNDVGDK